jgi:4-hydroxybenzoate polyprenyltransferase
MNDAALTSGTERALQEHHGDSCPLILDFDDALLRPGFLVEMTLAYIKPNPLRAFRVMWWLANSWSARGRNNLTREVASIAEQNFDKLPVHEELVQLAKQAANQGRPVYLTTTSDAPIAVELARHFPFLTGIISEGGAHQSGEAKAAALAHRFPDGFHYAGYARADLAVCRVARTASLVPMSQQSQRRTGDTSSFAAAFTAPSGASNLARGLRWQHWAKNLLVFVPILLAGRLTDWPALANTVLAFVAIGVTASATYLINDMLDLAEDRAHWSKRYRPLASGQLPIEIAAIAAPIGIMLGLLVGAMASAEVAGFLSLYLAITLAYSFGLKRVPIVDGLVLATLFTIRLVIGIAAADVRPSAWLLVFSMFLFASLSYAKRYTELARAIERNANLANGRGYSAADAPLVLAVGATTGIGAVLIMILYIVEDAFQQTFYGSTIWLWCLPPLVFLLISRMWLKSSRGEMSDDPVEFALKDRPTLVLGAMMTICFAFAWHGPFWT